MTLTVTDAITQATADEVEAEVLTLCASASPPLPTTSWQSGSVVLTMIKVLSQVIANKTAAEVEIARGGLGDLTSAEWAKLWAQAIYNVIFISAAPATGDVTITNASTTNQTFNVGELIVAHATTGKTYRNQASITVSASSSLANIAVQADEVGTASNAAPGEITTLVSSRTGITVTNPLAVLGADEESTSALVSRARAKLGSFSPNGPKDAYNYVATTPLDSFPAVEGTTLTPTSTPITRTRTTADLATGAVTVYLATAGGAPSGGDVALVQLGIERWAEPWCTTATAAAAANVSVDVTYQVWLKSTQTTAQVQATIATALAAYLAGVPVGGYVVPPDTGAIYTEELSYVIRTAVPGISRVNVTVPAGASVALTADQVPVVGTVVGTVSFI